MHGLLSLLRAGWRWLTGNDNREENRPARAGPVADGEGRRPDTVLAEQPEQHIEQLLDAGGGRLRQQAIIAATDWSPATVSRYLSRMEDTGQVVRVPVGREKTVCLPTAVPTDAVPVDDSARS